MTKSLKTPEHDVLSEYLADLRKEQGFTQRELAKKLGVARSVIAKMETSERRVDLVELVRICKALKVDTVEVAVEVLALMADRRRKKKT